MKPNKSALWLQRKENYMKVEFKIDLPIKAEPIDDHYNFSRKDRFDVSNIEIDQIFTHIELFGFSDEKFNSVHFKFYLHNRLIDIYSSGLFNKYKWQCLPMIHFIS